MPKGKEALIYSISDTLKLACNATSEHDVYLKVFSKISRLFYNGVSRLAINEFSNLLLLYPTDSNITDFYIFQRISYINRLLGITESDTNYSKL